MGVLFTYSKECSGSQTRNTQTRNNRAITRAQTAREKRGLSQLLRRELGAFVKKTSFTEAEVVPLAAAVNEHRPVTSYGLRDRPRPWCRARAPRPAPFTPRWSTGHGWDFAVS